MAYLAKLWNKDTAINGVAAEEVLKDAFMRNARQLFIVYDEETEIITRLESIDVIKMNNKLSGYSDDEVMAWYLEDMNKVPEPVVEVYEPTQAELDLMEGQLAIYEMNAAIYETVSTMAAAQ